MSGATFSDVDTYGLLKELYSDDVKYQEHVKSSFYNFLKKFTPSEVQLDGKYFNCPTQFALNESYGLRNDGERLPDPDFHAAVYAKFRAKLAYAAIEMTTFAATRGHNKGRPNGKFIESEIKSTFLSFMANSDSDALGNGRGLRATVLAATPAATSFTVTFSTRLRAKMVLDWYDSTLATKRGTVKIALKSIDRMGKTVYIDTGAFDAAVPAGAAAGDILVAQGSLAANEPSDGRGPCGYARTCDNSVSVGELSPSDYAAWSATVINAGLANPNELILQQFWDAMYVISGSYANRMGFNPAWKRSYMQGFLNQRRFPTNNFDTGMASLSWSPVRMGKDEAEKRIPRMEMLEDKNIDPTECLLWVYDAIGVATDFSAEPHLADEDGAEFRLRHNYDSMHGFIRHWWQIVTPQRNAVGRIYNFASPAGVI